MSEKLFVSGDEAVALAVRQAKPHVIAAYPITPQTIVVERLSDFVEDGSLNSQYMYVESEHSAMSACLGRERDRCAYLHGDVQPGPAVHG